MFTQETDYIVDIRIVRQTKDVVIGLTGLLLGGQVLGQISNDISCCLDRSCRPGEAGSCRGVNPGGVIDKIGGKTGIGFDLLVCEIAGQLVDNGRYHFQMAQFFSTESGGETEEYVRNPCAARDCGIEQRRNSECAKTGVAV